MCTEIGIYIQNWNNIHADADIKNLKLAQLFFMHSERSGFLLHIFQSIHDAFYSWVLCNFKRKTVKVELSYNLS